MSNKTKKQHYVPQFYLKNFANKNKNGFFIYCYDINQNKQYPANIRNIAEEKDFYKIGSENFEEFFQNTEELASPIINNLSKTKKIKPLNISRNRYKLSFFMSVQYFRTNEMRQDLLENFSKISNHLKKYPMNTKMEMFNNQIDKKFIKHHQINFINKSSQEMTASLVSKKWIVLKNKTEIEFITSDNPIVLYNPNGLLGFACEHIHIFYPINPKLCLCLLDPENYSNYKEPKKFKNNEIILNIMKTKEHNINSIDEINFINDLQAMNATQHIFSKNDNFDRIKYLTEHKKIIPSNERERVKMKVLKNPKNGNDILVFSHPNDNLNFEFKEFY